MTTSRSSPVAPSPSSNLPARGGTCSSGSIPGETRSARSRSVPPLSPTFGRQYSAAPVAENERLPDTSLEVRERPETGPVHDDH